MLTYLPSNEAVMTMTGPSLGNFRAAESSVPIEGRNPVLQISSSDGLPDKAMQRTVRRSLVSQTLRKRLRCAGVGSVQHVEWQAGLNLRTINLWRRCGIAIRHQSSRWCGIEVNSCAPNRGANPQICGLYSKSLFNLEGVRWVVET